MSYDKAGGVLYPGDFKSQAQEAFRALLTSRDPNLLVLVIAGIAVPLAAYCGLRIRRPLAVLPPDL